MVRTLEHRGPDTTQYMQDGAIQLGHTRLAIIDVKDGQQPMQRTVGDFVTLDFGALYNGYISDTTRTIAVGQPSDKLVEMYNVVLESQLLALEKVGPGMTGAEADAISRDYLKSKGYGEAFGHSLGHGIGLEVHEGPGLNFRSAVVLEPNMAVTIEPGVYLPGIGGVRIEDDILITETGNELLTHSTKELIII